jgi:hypothetical protein
MVLCLLPDGLHQRSAQREDHDCPGLKHCLRYQYCQPVFLGGKSIRSLVVRMVNFGRCLVATRPHMTAAPVSTVWIQLSSVPRTLASSTRKIAKSYPKLCREVANGASIGTRTQPSPRKYACLETRCRLTFYSANFKRVPCPTELTSKTQCTRTDEKQLISGDTSSATTFSPQSSVLSLVVAAGMLLV